MNMLHLDITRGQFIHCIYDAFRAKIIYMSMDSNLNVYKNKFPYWQCVCALVGGW